MKAKQQTEVSELVLRRIAIARIITRDKMINENVWHVIGQHRGQGLDGKNGTGILTDRTARVCRDNKPTDILEKGGKTLYIRCIKQSR